MAGLLFWVFVGILSEAGRRRAGIAARRTLSALARAGEVAVWHFLRIDFRASSLAKRAEFPRDAEHEIACEIVCLAVRDEVGVHSAAYVLALVQYVVGPCENGQRPVAEHGV